MYAMGDEFKFQENEYRFKWAHWKHRKSKSERALASLLVAMAEPGIQHSLDGVYHSNILCIREHIDDIAYNERQHEQHLSLWPKSSSLDQRIH